MKNKFLITFTGTTMSDNVFVQHFISDTDDENKLRYLVNHCVDKDEDVHWFLNKIEKLSDIENI
jgi:hypothetical protein